jgi:hypothetical protein
MPGIHVSAAFVLDWTRASSRGDRCAVEFEVSDLRLATVEFNLGLGWDWEKGRTGKGDGGN